MFKAMVALKRAAGVSFEDFNEHCEKDEITRWKEDIPGLISLTRHYLHAAPYPLDGSIVEAEYDLLIELCFTDQTTYVAGLPAMRRRLDNTDAAFVDRAKNALAEVEEHESDLPWMEGRAFEEGKDIRSFVLLKRKDGLSLEDFIHYYEDNHAPLGVRHVPVFSRYKRLFLKPVDLGADGWLAPAYDVATEVAYPDREAQSKAAEILSAKDISALVEADEDNFIDKPTRRFMTVESLVD